LNKLQSVDLQLNENKISVTLRDVETNQIQQKEIKINVTDVEVK